MYILLINNIITYKLNIIIDFIFKGISKYLKRFLNILHYEFK